ncbi:MULTISPECIES: IS1380 family transposase [unclassified Sporosarcina]|uniref:IS1380 family transposase n=1 Tax=unclassified Sporosarcina TaxID=2647733 RepID=UPI00203EBECC|nr:MULTISPECIES: IS1380 family transposase [unclassified Sporosarcina]GKV67489.1 IS1380 family transposase [Sporosarcina sp. NCCP-2331]GLB57854.1 IS1380 family transposase [Sporosarcina sp. NCCP-2378]
MPTLTQNTLNFNCSIKLSNDGGELSSDTGTLVFREFDEKLGFSQTIANHLQLVDERTFCVHENHELLQQKIYQLIAGYQEDDAADYLTTDPVFTQILAKPALASQPSLSRFFHRFDSNALDQLQAANQTMLDQVHRARQAQALIVDLDSSHADTYGQQEEAAYNAHYQTVGFHPLVAFDGLTGDFLKAKLRPGNVYTSNGVVDFIRPVIEHYNEQFPETSYLVRGDSGFAVPKLYELCEKESFSYIIRLKSNAKLQALAEELHPTDEIQDISKTEYYVEDSIYQAASWSKSRRIVIQSTRPAGELFFRHAFFVTSLGECFSPQAIVYSYQQRGTMENFIKEAKDGFGFDQMKSHDFTVNSARMMISLLAYNLTNWLRTLSFPNTSKGIQIGTIRTRLVKVASKLVKSGRYLHMKISSHFVYDRFFWDVLARVQRLQFN